MKHGHSDKRNGSKNKEKDEGKKPGKVSCTIKGQMGANNHDGFAKENVT